MINPAGWLHWKLSRKRLTHVLQQRTEALDLVASRRDVFTKHFQVQVIKGVVAGREFVAPLTRTADCLGGTMRQQPDHHPETLGCVGMLTVPALCPVSVAVAAFSRLEGDMCLPCEALGQVTAGLTFGVKAVLSGIAAGATLPVATWRAHRAAATFSLVSDDHRHGQPCVNDSTLVALEALTSVPEALFFRTACDHGYDIRELIEAIKTSRQWRVPHSLLPMARQDRVKLYRHSSGLGRSLEAWMARYACVPNDISQGTRDALAGLAKSLRDDPEQTKETKFIDVVHRLQTLPEEERQAVNKYMGYPGMPFIPYLDALREGRSCTQGFAQSLEVNLARVAATPPRYR